MEKNKINRSENDQVSGHFQRSFSDLFFFFFFFSFFFNISRKKVKLVR